MFSLQHREIYCMIDRIANMAPLKKPTDNDMHGFKLVCSFKSNDTIPVHKYISTNSGLSVFIADIDGPLVCGYYCLATEAFDDDGLPHTLEHLIFIGSEEYPYKGVLDLLANRCLASGTNAWTDVDHTAYTMETAGSEGFLSLLPIYIEHILFPTLTDSAYTTEVHHITGKGEDAGIVYCEMQGCVNTGETLTYTNLLRAAYPGKCGYKSFTGGDLPNLRESTSNEKVRNYHKEFYRPENLTIIITGQIKHEDVFKALEKIDKKIASKGPRNDFNRPWQSPVPPLVESCDLDVYYPCDDEDNGLMIAGWRGPSAVEQFYDLTGCSLLLKYLTSTEVSPLQKEFVEIDDPYANNVSYNVIENSTSLLIINFDNVPKEKIPLIKDHLMKVLKDIASDENGIKMKRLKTVIQKYILETLSNLENNPHSAIATMLIGNILYGNANNDLDQRLNEIEILKKLMTEPLSYWMNLLNTYFIDAPVVISKGIPSIEKKVDMAKEENKRITKQIESLGKEGLAKKELELKQAITENEKIVPDEMLTSVPIPSTDTIHFHRIKSFSTNSTEQHPKFNVDKLPFYTYLDHAKSNFIYFYVVMDTSNVPEDLRPYIPLLLETILVSPVNRDGKLIPYEEVVTELESETVYVSSGIGLTNGWRFSCDIFSNAACLMLQVELSKYAKGVQWIKELLYQTEFISERLKVIGSKILNDVATVKREGSTITELLLKGLLYKKESNHYNSSLLRQQTFLTKVMKRLETVEGQKEVIAEMNGVRKILTMPQFMNLHMAFNVDTLVAQNSNIYAPWNQYFSDIDSSNKSILNILPDHSLIKTPEEISLNGCVTGLGCVESAFMIQCIPCMKDYLHPDMAPLLVYLQYLTQTEGPMWKKIRGKGLSYGYSMYVMENEGLLYLSLYTSANIIGAYKEAKEIIECYLSKEIWESTLFDSAKSSLMFHIIEREKTVQDLVKESLLSHYKNIPQDYNLELVKNISLVTLEDIHRVAPKFIKKLLEPKYCKTTIVCHPNKTSEVAEAFKELGHDLQVYNSLEETYLSKW